MPLARVEQAVEAVRALADATTGADDFVRPGHVFPLRCREGRAGHTEASVDLARLASLYPAAVLSEIVRDDGRVARLRELERFAGRRGLPLLSIADLIRYRRRREKLVERASKARLPSRFGNFTVYAYRSLLQGTEHLAVIKGDVSGQAGVLVRVHPECATSDIFGSLRCHYRSNLDQALKLIAEEERGVVIYLRRPAPGRHGASHRTVLPDFSAFPGDSGWPAPAPAAVPPSDPGEEGIAAQILVDLGITTMRVLTDERERTGGWPGATSRSPSASPLPPSVDTNGSRSRRRGRRRLPGSPTSEQRRGPWPL
jgi:GTP cyclohydrolase II